MRGIFIDRQIHTTRESVASRLIAIKIFMRARAACASGQRISFRVLCAIAWVFAAARTIYAQESPTEYQVKAAYLFNFLKFVEWPEDPSTDAQRTVGDRRRRGRILSAMSWRTAVSGESVQGRELQVRSDSSPRKICRPLATHPVHQRVGE